MPRSSARAQATETAAQREPERARAQSSVLPHPRRRDAAERSSSTAAVSARYLSSRGRASSTTFALRSRSTSRRRTSGSPRCSCSSRTMSYFASVSCTAGSSIAFLKASWSFATIFGSMPFGPAMPNGRVEHERVAELLQRRHVRASSSSGSRSRSSGGAACRHRPAASSRSSRPAASCGRRAPRRWSRRRP